MRALRGSKAVRAHRTPELCSLCFLAGRSLGCCVGCLVEVWFCLRGLVDCVPARTPALPAYISRFKN